MRKLFRSMLVVLLVLANIPFVDVVNASSSFTTTENLDGTLTVTKYAGGGTVDIPATIGGKKVTVIGKDFLKNRSNWQILTSIIIPNTVTEIEESAFENAFFSSYDHTIKIPSSVKKIGASAFRYNGLTSVTIPEGLESIGASAFRSNKLVSVKLPESLNSLGDSAFRENKLSSVTIPSNITSIPVDAFFSNQLTSVKIPEGVTSIGKGAFAKNELTSVTIPNSVRSLSGFWQNVNLTNVIIPNGVTSIEQSAFSETRLTSVTIPDSVTFIGSSAFQDTQLTSVTIPDGVTSIQSHTFRDTPLTSVTIPDSVTVINSFVFQNTQLTSVTIPDSVTFIGGSAFQNTQLTSVTIPDSVTYIGSSAFQDTQLTSVTIPGSVTTIAVHAFSGNRLEHIVFEGKPSIGDNSFRQDFQGFGGWYTDPSLITAWNGKSIPSHGKVYAKTTLPSSPSNVSAVASDTQADVFFTASNHSGTSDITGYKVKVYVDGIEQPNLSKPGNSSPITVPGLKNGTDYTFRVIASNSTGDSFNSEATEIVTPGTYQVVENQDKTVTITKYNGTETEVVIPSEIDGITVTGIGVEAYSRKQLTSVTIPASVTAIKQNAFSDNQIEQITFDGNQITIDSSAFSTTETAFPEFVGWYTDKSLETVWDGTSVPIDGKVYAKRTPNPPTNVKTEVGDRKVTVSFTGPVHTGGNTVTDYTVKAYVGGIEQLNLETPGNASPITVKGLTHGTNYTFKVTATNKAGHSVESAASDAVEAVEIFETTDNDDGTVTIKKYNGKETVVDIPSEIDGKEVSEIGMYVFNNKNLTNVTIPYSVKKIGVGAFSYNKLTSVTIPKGVENIGSSAFDNNSLETIIIPGSVKRIESKAFSNNAELMSVTIEDGVTEIGDYAFNYTSLTSVTIPGSVKSIGNNAFDIKLNKLTSVTINEIVTTIGDYAFFDNSLSSVTIPNSVTALGEYAFSKNKLTSVTIPQNVEIVGSYSFAYNQLEQITFEGSPVLGTEAFNQLSSFYQGFRGWYADPEFKTEWDGASVPAGKKLYGKRTPNPPKEVSAIAGVEEATVSFTGPTHIGGNAVTGYLVKVYVGETEQTDLQATGIASPITVSGLANGTTYTFKVVATNAAGDSIDSLVSDTVVPVVKYETTINQDGTVTITGYNGTEKDVEIPSQINGMAVSAIGEDAFKEKGLTTVEIPVTVTSIGKNAFSHNQLTTVTIPSNVLKIGAYAFSNNKITDVSLPSGIGEVGDYAFSANELTSLTIPGSLGKIGDNAFSNNKLTSISIPPSLGVMGKGAFSYNKLENVTIELGVGTIADSAFSHNKLTTVSLPISVSTIGANAFASNRLERVTFNSEPTIGTDAFKQDDASIFPAFVGWYTAADLQDQNAWNGTSVLVGKELYAKRKPNQITAVTAKAGVSQVTVSFTGPIHTGGNVVTGYTVKVYEGEKELTELETTGIVSPITVKGLQSGKAYTFKVIATNAAGNGEESVSSASVKPTAPSNNNGGTNPSPNPNPAQEIITVPVEAGEQGSNVSTATIKRTTDAKGNKKDELEWTPAIAAETVRNLKEAGTDKARIAFPDAKDEVTELNLSINKEAIQAFQQGAINLEVYTENARIIVPKDSVNGIRDNLYFRVIPIKAEQQKNEVKERAKKEKVVSEVAGSSDIHVVGRPMTIETNMPNQPVDIILPLKDVTIPTEEKEREEFFNKLGVFIEHSDGEKVFIKGEVVPYKNGELGLKFTINKFSTFTIINMENGWKEPNYNNQFTGRTSELELPVMTDKVWTITFNQAANPDTVNENTVYLYDEKGGKVAIDLQLTNNNRSIKISPKTYYKPNTNYYLYLSEKMESANGKQLGTPERYVFKTTSYSLETGKRQEETSVSPTKEWKVTFNTNINEALLTDNHLLVTDQHGRKVDVVIELMNPKTVQIRPIKPYNHGKTYYLFMKDLASDTNVAMKNQTWMKFTIESKIE
ncbi:leucine-rich repeat protein [Sporosarcina sp. GW1-11]|uniref:leucine-rich repeat protein n=1 Tax=Sporosarcina sp. GW1-11 TaxID=2899126 RepID=UPI00294BEDA4|nr:leucine-rich repeat protein [Sporosarcina sp. GW1-11]MDV6377760.1 leucine-rich repeat protein [Sporosarcina sp. GW1-11]